MNDIIANRRKVLIGGAFAAAGAVASGAAAAQDGSVDPNTPITDSLLPEYQDMLTDKAASLTEADAVMLNTYLRHPEKTLPDHFADLSIKDVESLIDAFGASMNSSYKVASVAPSLVGTSFGASCCCTCTPASCCCAAAQTTPSRSRFIA